MEDIVIAKPRLYKGDHHLLFTDHHQLSGYCPISLSLKPTQLTIYNKVTNINVKEFTAHLLAINQYCRMIN